MERDSIVFYRSFYEAIRLQPKKIQADIYNAVLDYAFNGTEPNISPAAMSIFYLIKPQIDANNKKFEDGKKGGRPRKTKTTGSEDKEEIKTSGFENDRKTETTGFENDAKNSVEKKPNEECRMSNVNEECRMSNVNENENEKKEIGAPKKKSGAGAPVYFPLDSGLDEAFKDFIDMRKQIKKPMTARAIEMLIAKINGIGDNNRAIECLNESTLHCWQSIYPEKTRGKPEKSGNPFMDIYNELKGDEDNDPY